MKKLSMLIIVISLLFASCSKDDNNQQTSYVNVKESVNQSITAEDFTDDGVENFIERPSSQRNERLAFYYKDAEKKVLLYTKDSEGRETLNQTFDVVSGSYNDAVCQSKDLNCTFRFLGGEVHQIYKYSIGYRRVRYFRI